ncbi:hypothetical protein BAE44_0018130 [Dichanthelium oligosanthes]|uniref:Uncharacterized protein n=1 Tax=Dichanthelium oligosanthes TaxID=888268 RepID=A0A1E5V6V7_9POAL|nr:hypothetical protein BAE44_0018130 [Dichanthelium oligosanthes]
MRSITGERWFEAHGEKRVDSLAVHPTDPLLLTASSQDKSIKLWDCDRGWACTRVFEHDGSVRHLEFGPWDTNTFASYSPLHKDVKVCLICLFIS